MSEIVKSPQPDHEILHRALVEHIVAELRPVRRLWPVSYRLGLMVVLEIVVSLFLIHYGYRSNLTEQLRNPWYLLGVGGFAIAGAIGAAFALRTAIPGREPSAKEMGALAALAAVSALMLLKQPVDTSVPLGIFVAQGLRCALGTVVTALLPFLALLWAVRRGAPLAARLEGALVGAGAFLFSFALMRVRCPIDEGTHLIVWHLLPALVGIALVACISTVLLRKRRSREGRA